MQNKLVSFVVVVPIAVMSGVLALLASAAPQSASLQSNVQKFPPPPRCSARTIAGDYAYTIEGTLLISPPLHSRFTESPWLTTTAKEIRPRWITSS